MSDEVETALLIALNNLLMLLEEKGVVSRAEFTEALRLEKKARPKELAAVLEGIAQQIAPRPLPTLTAIEGGKEPDRLADTNEAALPWREKLGG